MNLTQRLAQFIDETRYDQLPASIVEKTKWAFLDWLGVTLAGSSHESSVLIFKTLRRFSGRKQATILGLSEGADIFSAALLNGYFSHVLDYDDLHVGMLGHPSVPIIPALLSLAEWKRKSGKDFILAYSLGVDLECRLGEAVNPQHYDRGWHSTSTLGHLGSAVGAAKLLNLDVGRMVHAIGIAGTLAGGVRQVIGTMCKPLHPGKAAANGLQAAILAESGFTSSQEMIGGAKGFTSVLCDKFDPSVLTRELGREWKVDEIAFKRHASCYRTLAVIECVLSLRPRLPQGIEKIDSIRCRVPPIALDHAGIIIPKNGLEAKFSQPFCAAVALVEGKARDEQFTDEQVARPVLLGLLEKTKVQVDDTLHPAEAKVEIVLNDGTVHTEQIDIERVQPPDAQVWVDLKEKFQTLVSRSMTEEKGRALLDSVMTLEEAKDFRRIIELCS